MDHFRAVVRGLNKKANVGLVTALVALSTAGGEQIFSLVVFSCPCNGGNRLYGAVSFFAPALVLLALGYILNRDTWKLVTGLALRKTNLKDTLRTVAMYLVVSNTAWIAPLCWFAVALLGGNYYVCALAGENEHYKDHHLCGNMSWSRCQEERYKFPCRGRSTAVPQAEIDDVLATLRAESQILGWLYIAIITLFHLLMTCAARCRSRISDQKLRFRRLYAEQESGLLERYAAEHAIKLAKRNLDSFFFLAHTPPPPAFATPSSRDWEEISGFNRFDYELAMPLTATVADDEDRDYYSAIHQYVETERGSAGTTATAESAL